jgi:hypothetical protein
MNENDDGAFTNAVSMMSQLFDQGKLEVMRAQSLSRISSRNSSGRVGSDVILQKYSDKSKEELIELLVASELNVINLEDENHALIEQVSVFRSDLISIQEDFDKSKQSLSEIMKSRDSYKALAEKRESEIIFLEDHARFSADQTKLSISHWDLLLRNRDENIELLTNRVSQLTSDSRMGESGITIDKYKCLVERFKTLRDKGRQTSGAHSTEDDFPETSEDFPCPWRHQADVRVAQLERVTSQLNSTYEQLHSKSDELLLQNREIGSLRRRVSDLESKVKKQKLKILKLRNEKSSSLESSSIPQSDD